MNYIDFYAVAYYFCGLFCFSLFFVLAPTLRFWGAIKMSFYVYVCLLSRPKDLPSVAWFGCSVMAAFGRHVYEYAATRLGFAPLWVPVLYECPGTGAAFIIPIFIYITLSIFGCYFFFGRATALATGCCCHFCINFIFGLWVCALSFSCRCCLFRINNKYFWLLRLHSINIISSTPTHAHRLHPANRRTHGREP